MIKPFIILFMALTAALNVHAEADTQVSGFGTLGVSNFSNPHADYVYNQLPKGPGRSQTIDVGLDSNLGVQLDHAFSSRFNATLQAVSYHRSDDSYSPELSLGFVGWQATDQLRLRLGRLQNPMFIYSDVRMIHYSQPWVRPPKEAYGQLPNYHQDGIEAIWRPRLYKTWNTEVIVGSGSTDFAASSGIDVNLTLTYLSFALDRDEWLFKLSRTQGTANYRAPNLTSAYNALKQFNQAAIVNDLSLIDKAINILALSVKYEDDDWLILNETSRMEYDGLIGVRSGSYLTLGKKFADSMIYTTLATRWSSIRETSRQSIVGLSDQNSNTVYQNIIIPMQQNISNDVNSIAVGWKKELNETTTLKLQTDFIRQMGNSRGLNANQDSSYNYERPDTDVLWSVNLDKVF